MAAEPRQEVVAPHAGRIRESVGEAILAGADHQLDPTRPDDHLAIVERAAEADRVARDLLDQAVRSARGSGHSWAAIGSVLGLTRQAAQQRFSDKERGADAAETRNLGPVTAFDEMGELEQAGRLGWRTVGIGMFTHQMVRTPTQWEHRRVIWGRPAGRQGEGWQVAVRSFPWIYLVRDLGVPAEPELTD